MANRHNTEKRSIGPNQPLSREVEHPTIDSKNSFEVPSDFIEQYPHDIPIQPTLYPSYTCSPNSSSNEELQGVYSKKLLYLIPKTEVNQLRHHT